MSDEAAKGTIRSFRVDVPQEDLDDLRRRITSMRWPEKETVEDESQGVRLETMRELAFEKHTYGHTTLGYKQDVEAMNYRVR